MEIRELFDWQEMEQNGEGRDLIGKKWREMERGDNLIGKKWTAGILGVSDC